MKHIVQIIGLAAIMLFSPASFGQDEERITIPLSNPGEAGKLTVHLIDGSIKVQGHDSDDVVVIGKLVSKKHSKKNKEKNGMKRLENNDLSFTVEEFENKVRIKKRVANGQVDFTVMVPRNFSVDLKTVNNGRIVVDGLNGTHEASNTNGPISMTNVGGSVIADALNQDITVTFKSVYDDTAMMFASLNGDIDVTFPSDLKATVTARTDNGNVYTDFEMKTSKSGQRKEGRGTDGVYRVTQERGVTGDINGGGIEIKFKTLNGDILIRSNN